METIETQKIDNKEDLELLIERDKVYVDFGENYGERLTIINNKKKLLRLATRCEGEILEYIIEKSNIDVDSGFIIGKNPLINGIKKGEEYDIYNKIIGEDN